MHANTHTLHEGKQNRNTGADDRHQRVSESHKPGGLQNTLSMIHNKMPHGRGKQRGGCLVSTECDLLQLTATLGSPLLIAGPRSGVSPRP